MRRHVVRHWLCQTWIVLHYSDTWHVYLQTVRCRFRELKGHGPKGPFSLFPTPFPLYIMGNPNQLMASHFLPFILPFSWELTCSRYTWASLVIQSNFFFSKFSSHPSFFLPLLLFLLPSSLWPSNPLKIGRIGIFNPMVDSLERLVKFRRIYGILDDVGLSYCPESKVDFVMVEGRVVITLVAFAGGGGGWC